MVTQTPPDWFRSPRTWPILLQGAGIAAGLGSVWEHQDLSTHRGELAQKWQQSGLNLGEHLSHVVLDT